MGSAGVVLGAASAVLVGAVLILTPISSLPHYNHLVAERNDGLMNATHFAIFSLLDNDTETSKDDSIRTIEVIEKYISKNDRGNYIIQSIRSLENSNGEESSNQASSNKREDNLHVHTYRNYYDAFPREMKMMTVQSLDNLTRAFEIGQNEYSNVAYILYDIEHWKKTPEREQNDAVRSISLGANKVHANGFKYGLTPDAQLLIDNYRRINWTEVDFLGIQYQRYSQNITQFSEYTKEITNFVKAQNPSTKVFVQLSFRFTGTNQMIDAINSVRSWVDGYIIAYLPGSDDCHECNHKALDTVLKAITQVDSNKPGI